MKGISKDLHRGDVDLLYGFALPDTVVLRQWLTIDTGVVFSRSHNSWTLSKSHAFTEFEKSK